MQLGSMFISNCNNTLNVSDAICVHPQEHLKTIVTAEAIDLFDMLQDIKRRGEVSYIQYDLMRKTSTLDALTGYFTPSHVKHQRLSLQFLSAPEDGRK
jgi:hypothetical protein